MRPEGLIHQLQEVRVHMKTMASHWRGFGVVKEGISSDV